MFLCEVQRGEQFMVSDSSQTRAQQHHWYIWLMYVVDPDVWLFCQDSSHCVPHLSATRGQVHISLSHPGAGQISRPGLIWLTALWRLGSACSCVGSTRPRHWSYFWFLLYNLICCCSLLLLSGTDWVCQEPGAFHAASRLQEKEKSQARQCTPGPEL